MRDHDVEAIEKIIKSVSKDITINSAVAVSGESMEIDLCKRLLNLNLKCISEKDWNLYNEYNGNLKVDVVFACNTFMCSKDPKVWLKNISKVSKYIIIQDLSKAARGQGRITAPDSGDFMRYSVTNFNIIGKTDDGAIPVFDFSNCGINIINCIEYFEISPNSFGKFVLFADISPLLNESI